MADEEVNDFSATLMEPIRRLYAFHVKEAGGPINDAMKIIMEQSVRLTVEEWSALAEALNQLVYVLKPIIERVGYVGVTGERRTIETQ